ncbi:MAG: hypothetical protein HYU37_04960 [Acidobacteria bacterium]|nr:hypothetical protein [Acidobacteriota bacterium]
MTKVRHFNALAAVVVASIAFVWMSQATPAAGHHSIAAEFNLEKTGSFTGVLTRFAMINPHVRWFFKETRSDGTVVEWEMTGAGPGALRSAGLVRIFVTGQTYKVTFAPARDGSNLGRLRTLTLPDGRVVTLYHEDPSKPFGG